MKIFNILLLTLTSFSSLASATPITVDEDTKVLAIRIRSERAHSCPNRALDLKIEAQNLESYKITGDYSAFKYMQQVKKLLDEETRTKVYNAEVKLRNRPVCLSFGKSSGEVFLRVDGGETIEVELEKGYEVAKIEQLK